MKRKMKYRVLSFNIFSPWNMEVHGSDLLPFVLLAYKCISFYYFWIHNKIGRKIFKDRKWKKGIKLVSQIICQPINKFLLHTYPYFYSHLKENMTCKKFHKMFPLCSVHIKKFFFERNAVLSCMQNRLKDIFLALIFFHKINCKLRQTA